MFCPNCCEQFSLWKAFKLWIYLKLPDSYHYRIERRQENKELVELKKLYNTNADLTEREHFVCSRLVRDAELEMIAYEMNVTRERIRQIKSKALRKLQRKIK